MKKPLLVCGSRSSDGIDPREVLNIILDIYFKNDYTEIITGLCPTGVDAIAKGICIKHKIPFKGFPANWKKYGKAAGPIRNDEMARYVSDHNGGLIVFDGGRGTANMLQQAMSIHVKRIKIEYNELGGSDVE